jgi:hypothetical protein
MSRKSRKSEIQWRTLGTDALFLRARSIAEGNDGWSSDDLRDAFVSRLLSGQDPLGDQYCASFSIVERRASGATLTPPRIVAAMLEWANRQAQIIGKPHRIIDPGAGSGRFTVCAAKQFPDAAIIAVENDPYMLLLLRANIRAAGLSHRITIIDADFRAISLEPIAGSTLFVGNPPYVRHHHIGQEWKRWYVRSCAEHGVKASQLAGLHLHFFAKVAELGKAGDIGCFITAAEWLDVGYGAALKSLLSGSLGGKEIHLLEPTVNAFPGTMTTAAITGFCLGRPAPELRVRRVQKLSDLDRLEGGKLVNWSEAQPTAKWSLLVYPRPRPTPGTVEFGEICRVHRGQVTGNNRVWIVGPKANCLPARFLRPTVTRAEELIRAEPVLDDASDLARVIDLPPSLEGLSDAERAGVDEFVAWAKAVGAADGYIARHRRPWWAIRLRDAAPIVCTYMARRPPAFVRNRAGARLLNIAHGLYPRENLSENELLRLVNVLRIATRREHGRTYSGGLTKFEPREVERIHIPWPQ